MEKMLKREAIKSPESQASQGAGQLNVPQQSQPPALKPKDGGRGEVDRIINGAKSTGFRVEVGKLAEKFKRALFCALLALVQTGLTVFTLYEEGKELSTKVIAQGEGVKRAETAVAKQFGQDDTHNYVRKTYSISADNVDKLMEVIGLADFWAEYQELFNGQGVTSRRDQQARELTSVIMLPVVERKLLLARDEEGNTFWASAYVSNASGELRYDVHQIDKAGKRKLGLMMRPSEVAEMTPKIGKALKCANAKFSTLDGQIAVQRLWLWNLFRAFIPEAPLWDDMDVTDIFEEIREYIWRKLPFEIASMLAAIKRGEKYVPGTIYINRIGDRIDVGIWAASMGKVFQNLQIPMKPSAWIREAVSEGWIRRDLSSNRNAYTPSDLQLELYNRERKGERVYLFEFDEDKMRKLYDKIAEDLEKAKGQVAANRKIRKAAKKGVQQDAEITERLKAGEEAEVVAQELGLTVEGGATDGTAV